MANFFEWENGEEVQGQTDVIGYVEIDGEQLPVYAPKISGNTPITAENLNRMEELIADEFENTITYINNIFTDLTVNSVSAGTAHDSHSGGYYRIGNIIIVNVTVKGTSTGNKNILTGFPRPAQGVVACACSTATNGTTSYATISSSGYLEVNIVSTSNTYRIMGVYIAND